MADLPVLYQNNSQFQSVYSHAQKEGVAKVSGLVGSKHTFLVRSLFTQHPTTVVWILRDKEEAAYFLNDLEVFMEQRPLFFPSSYRRQYSIEETDNANVLMRAEVLEMLREHPKQLVVSYPEALFEQVLTPKEIKRKTL